MIMNILRKEICLSDDLSSKCWSSNVRYSVPSSDRGLYSLKVYSSESRRYCWGSYSWTKVFRYSRKNQ